MQLEAVVHVQWHLHDIDVVYLRADAVHSVGRWAGQDLILAGCAEASEQGVDGFIGSDTDEEALGLEGFLCVVVGITEVAEELLKFDLVTESRNV